MKVAVGNDHHGVELKKMLIASLEAAGHIVVNAGTDAADAVDYPDFAGQVANQVSQGQVDRGVLICGSGTGMAIAANKVQGVRAAVCRDQQTAELSRQHNDTNVICLSGQFVDAQTNVDIVTTWLATGFDGGRHLRRVNKIGQLEAPHTNQS